MKDQRREMIVSMIRSYMSHLTACHVEPPRVILDDFIFLNIGDDRYVIEVKKLDPPHSSADRAGNS